MKLSVKEIALDLDTDPRTLRKFLRSPDSKVDPVGKGSRYAIDAKRIPAMRKRFDNWVAAQASSDNEVEATDEVAIDES